MTTAMVLQACGGGGDPSVPDDLSDLGLTQASIEFVNPPTTPLNQGISQSNQITIRLTDGSNGALPNEIVAVSTDTGTLNLDSVVTNASGEASFFITLTNEVEGQPITISATYNNTQTNVSATDSRNFAAGPAADTVVLAVSVLDLDTQLPVATLTPSAAGNTVSLTLTRNGQAASNENVVLSTTSGTLSNSSVTTNTSGIATATINTQGITSGVTVIITATHQETSASTTAITGATEFQLTLSLPDNDDDVLTPDQGNAVQVSLANLTSPGQSENGQVILFGTTIGSFTPSQVRTATNGTATTTLNLEDVVENQAGTLTASFNDGTNSFTGTLNVAVGPRTDSDTGTGTSGDITLTAIVENSDGEATSELNTTTGNQISISLTESTTNPDVPAPLRNKIISISTTIGTLEPSSGNILTDTEGNATARINSEGIEEGSAGVITVTYEDTAQGTSIIRTINVRAGETAAGSSTVTTIVAALYDEREYLLNPPTDGSAIDLTEVSQLTQINAIQPAIFEVRINTETTTINSSGVATTTVEPIPSAILSVEASLGQITPVSGNIITDEFGIATLTLSVGSAQSGEAGTIVARTSNNTPSNSVTFSIGSSNLVLGIIGEDGFEEGALSIENSTLAAGGRTLVTVGVFNTADAETESDDPSPYLPPIEVEFTSECVEAGLATIDASERTTSGQASVTYTANGCVTDNITATLANVDGPSANGSLSVTDSTPSSISFESATPTTIALRGTGGNGRQESSEVQFIVIDNTGEPEAGVTVNFALSTSAGGVSLVSDSGITDATGAVIARVDAGNVPTPIRVAATISETSISTVSDVLVISTGLPDQGSFTVSATNLNPGGGDFNGVTTDVTVRAADAFNNPVPDGTAISFTTEYGAIDDSCITEEGACTVTWNSQAPRSQLTFDADDITQVTCLNAHRDFFTVNTMGMPCLNPSFARPNGAYNNILAYAIGEESFVDANANGIFDALESFTDTNGNGVRDDGEAFVDANGNGEYDAPFVETYTDANGNGVYDFAEEFTDTNGNGAHDAGESFTDSNNNCEYDAAEEFTDSNGNGVYNEAESFTDSNVNGEYDEAESFIDANMNGIYDVAEPFTDANGNDQYDDGEAFEDNNDNNNYDRAEAFTDTNDNGEYDSAEEFIDANENNTYDGAEPFTDANNNDQYDFAEAFVDADGDDTFDAGEAFIDRNKNCVYDIAEVFEDTNDNGEYDRTVEIHNDITEAFLDHNDNNTYDNPTTLGSCAQRDDCTVSPGVGGDEETFIDFNSNNEFDNGNSIYNGSLCSDIAEAAGACSKNLVNVYEDITIVMSAATPYFLLYNNDGNAMIGGSGTSNVAGFTKNPIINLRSMEFNGEANLTLYISDRNNGPLPAGTTIQISSTNCTVQSTTNFEFASNARSYIAIGIQLVEDEASDEEAAGSVTATVTLPASNGGAVHDYSFSCLDR